MPITLTDADRAEIARIVVTLGGNTLQQRKSVEAGFVAGVASGSERAAQIVERKLFHYADVRECAAAIRLLNAPAAP